MFKTLSAITMLVLLGLAGFTGYRLVQSRITGDIYRQRLVTLHENYEQLRSVYNQAVRKTAITELLVHDGRVDVVVRDAAGEVATIQTPYDPGREIYVDYVVVNGRLWIRRVFDARTPPSEGVLVDPQLGDIDWDADGAVHGKAAYRTLTDGRWIVTVTGDGSLGLTKCDDCGPVELANAPAIRDYSPIEEAAAAVESITPVDVLRYAVP